MNFSAKKVICMIALPLFYFSVVFAYIGSYRQHGIFTSKAYLPIAFMLAYIIYLTLLKGYNSMSVSRFKNTAGLLTYFYKKSILQACIFLLYSTAIYIVSSVILRLNIQFPDVARSLIFNFIALLIFNLYGIAFGIKFGTFAAKVSLVILFILMATLPAFSKMTSLHFLETLCFVYYNSISSFDALQIAKIILVYGLYILSALFVFFFWKKDVYGSKT